MSKIVLTGTDKVLIRMNKSIERIKKRTRGGLAIAALIVKRKALELTPHDTGHLKGSAYTEVHGSVAESPWAEIGYSAFYAVFVHEIDKDYKKGQYKFLETALKEKRKEVLDAIRQSAKGR